MAACVVDDGVADAGTYAGYGGASVDEHAFGYPGATTFHDGWSMEGVPQYWQEDAGEYGMQWGGFSGAGWQGADMAGMDPRGAQPQGDAGPGRQKRRFCTAYPDVSSCRRGEACAFAHSREEVRAQLLEPIEERQDPAALTNEFFMSKYKTLWCPIGVQHEWHTCVYAHNYQDARRPVSIGYGVKLCPYWKRKDTSAEYCQRCPLGLRCPYAHGAKEQLYHPQYFKTVICRDLRSKACPRHRLCAFFHQRSEQRTPPADDVDYSQPLPEEALPEKWVSEFLCPPFAPENGYQDQGVPGATGPGEMIASYSSQDAAQYPQCAMKPSYFFLMPTNDIMSVPLSSVNQQPAAEQG